MHQELTRAIGGLAIVIQRGSAADGELVDHLRVRRAHPQDAASACDRAVKRVVPRNLNAGMTGSHSHECTRSWTPTRLTR